MLINKCKPFNSFVGITSLDQIASKDDRVLVMNILGNESRKVTPVSHVFSGGNIVAGVQYGRPGVMKTAIGDIPVYSRLADAVEKHQFNVGVIYLPPTAVYHAVAELIHYNKQLKKIVIVTEKLSVKDQMQIRAIAQTNSIDVFGANSLGVADAWNRVRIGGGLGGDKPEELLVKGSIAVHSNSGNFSTTITEYLKTEGFGTTTLVSSGKDTIIQYPVAEFLYAAQNDPRTRAIVLYIEPGGFYEKIALDMIREGACEFTKPVIACITGHWKAKLSRAVGHAGALAGSNDDASSKEQWFKDYFGTDGFDVNNPQKVSSKGTFVNSIQHIPVAVKAVFDKLGMSPDFEPIGNLHLKPWFGNDFDWKLPENLKLPLVKALSPYDEEIEMVNRALGAVYLRQNMRNASGASTMNPTTHIAELHGKKVTDLAQNSLEQNIYFSLTKMDANGQDISLLNNILNHLSRIPKRYFELVEEAENNGATPNEALMVGLALTGNNKKMQTAQKTIRDFIKLYVELELRDLSEEVDWQSHKEVVKNLFELETGKTEPTALSVPVLTGVTSSIPVLTGVTSSVMLSKQRSNALSLGAYILSDFKVAQPEVFAITTVLFHLFFPALVRKKITRATIENSYAYISNIALISILSTTDYKANRFVQQHLEGKTGLDDSFTEIIFKAVFNYEPDTVSLKEFSTLIGITLTNGPGTISAKGAKESVSAGNNISTAFIGFLANSGLAHGGNGFEGIDYILTAFREEQAIDPAGKNIDVEAVAKKAATDFATAKKQAKSQGLSYRRIPGINHPVFKGKPVNIDPREDFIYKQFEAEGIHNVFWDFYKALVKHLRKQKITKNVYAVNIDAVIATISLKLIWQLYKQGKVSEKDMQKIGFSLFLLGRTVGIAAEIADHRNRGTDMDCRTPISETQFVM